MKKYSNVTHGKDFCERRNQNCQISREFLEIAIFRHYIAVSCQNIAAICPHMAISFYPPKKSFLEALTPFFLGANW
jgi:hypothetical protein